MKLSTILILAAIIAISVILYLVVSMRSKNKEKKKLQVLNDYASKHNCTITKNEIYGNISIGIDEKSNFLFFIKSNDETRELKHVNLSEIRNCKVVHTGRTVQFNNSSTKVIDRLDLCFNPVNKNKEQIQLGFYNVELDGSILNGELQLVEKWSDILNNKLSLTV
jgi:hypothetical protein